MMDESIYQLEVFSSTLFEVMKRINPGVEALELYEFRYGLNDLLPEGGWAAVKLEGMEAMLGRLNQRQFYDSIQIKPRLADRIVLDPQVIHLAQMLFVGLVTGAYPEAWVLKHFYFDLRGFFFLHRTEYFTAAVRAHLGGKPFVHFDEKQKAFETCQAIGYKQFKEANAEVDGFFLESVSRLVTARGTPAVLAIAGPTAAGKTEIVERLREEFIRQGRQIATMELDNYLTDREYREARSIHSEGRPAMHFELFRQNLEDLSRGRKVRMPRYDTVYATSSHNLDGSLKPGGVPIEIEPADIIFMEGNFPFLEPDVAPLIGIKVVYLTDDPIRLKRKWKRDIDYRKKYDPTYLRNRFFKDQFIMAQIAYRPQLETCDLAVDTTGAAVWVTPEIAKTLGCG
jgi:uridine kinase